MERNCYNESITAIMQKKSSSYFEKQEKFWPKALLFITQNKWAKQYLKQMGISVIINTTGAERYIHYTENC